MCVAICKPSGIELSEEILAACLHANADGFGLAYPNNGRVIVKKGLWKLEKIVQELAPLKDVPVLLHFRWTTHGGTTTANCHPFYVRKDLALIHNGILPCQPTRADFSDTRHFVQETRAVFFRPDWREKLPKIEKWHGAGNKLGLIDANGKFYRTGNWSKHEGAQFSNLNWQPTTAINYGYGCGAIGWTYDDDENYFTTRREHYRSRFTRGANTADPSPPLGKRDIPKEYEMRYYRGASYVFIPFSQIDPGDRFRFIVGDGQDAQRKTWLKELDTRISCTDADGSTVYADDLAANQWVWYESGVPAPSDDAQQTLPFYQSPPQQLNNAITCPFSSIMPGGYFSWNGLTANDKSIAGRLCQRNEDPEKGLYRIVGKSDWYSPSANARVFPQPAPGELADAQEKRKRDIEADEERAEGVERDYLTKPRAAIAKETSPYRELAIGGLYVMTKYASTVYVRGIVRDFSIGTSAREYCDCADRKHSHVHTVTPYAGDKPQTPHIVPRDFGKSREIMERENIRPTSCRVPSMSRLYALLPNGAEYQSAWNGPVFIKNDDLEHDPGAGVYAGLIDNEKPLPDSTVWARQHQPEPDVKGINTSIPSAKSVKFYRLPIGAVYQRFTKSPWLVKTGETSGRFWAEGTLGPRSHTTATEEVVYTDAQPEDLLPEKPTTPAKPAYAGQTQTQEKPKQPAALATYSDLPNGTFYAHQGKLYRKGRKGEPKDLEPGQKVKVHPHVLRRIENKKTPAKTLAEIVTAPEDTKEKTTTQEPTNEQNNVADATIIVD